MPQGNDCSPGVWLSPGGLCDASALIDGLRNAIDRCTLFGVDAGDPLPFGR